MLEKQKLKFAALLFHYAFPFYRWLYFRFKNKKDQYHLDQIQQLLKPGSVVLDIGANIGFFAKKLAEYVGPDGHVYCFEPDKINFKHLKNELKNNYNVTLVQKAVAEAAGIVTLYTSDLLNVDHRTYEPEAYTGKYTVEKTSIDEFINNRFSVDFIKMDIQGFEMNALKGMVKTLDKNLSVVLFIELWPYGLQQAGSSAVEVYDFFAQRNFNMYKIKEHQLIQMSRNETLNLEVDYFSDTNLLVSRKNLNEA